jgi:two-component system, cell cycle response regulator
MSNPRRLADATVVTAVSAVPHATPRNDEACLVVIVGADIGRRIPLLADETILGRAETAHVVLDLENVSRSHASLSRCEGGWLLRDLDSTNGTYVNDERVSEHVLRDGDQLQVGRAILKFLSGGNVEAHYHAEIYRVMTLDGLTQVHNRRYFEEALAREVARSQRYRHPFTLVLFDIDHFKRINDQHGHLTGDAVLKHVAQRVRSHVRSSDIVARVGGEEFAVLLPGTEIVGARTYADKLRQRVADDALEACGARLQATISIGVAEWAPSMASPAELYQAADEKLYEAKRSGRNCVKS